MKIKIEEFYMLQHKKIKSVYVWNENKEVLGYKTFKNWLSAWIYKLFKNKKDYKIVRKREIVQEEDI